MLQMIEDVKQKITAQKRFNALLNQAWRQRENREIIWRPSSRELDIAHDRRFWFVSVPPAKDQATKRYWNSFGLYKPGGGLAITVEINVPTETNSLRIAGFFARDPVTGITYLMHDGAVGGGRRGVGRDAFVGWSSARLVAVATSEGRERLGIIVCPLSKNTGHAIESFVRRVALFKQAVRNGLVLDDAAVRSRDESNYQEYYPEFSGKKRGARAKEIEYISRHGDVVDELARWRPASKKNRERIVKNAYIDLGIEAGGRLKVLYEVKTNTSRQSLYSALGQLLVHGQRQNSLERYVVLPLGDIIPRDVAQTFDSFSIKTLRYKFVGQRVAIIAR